MIIFFFFVLSWIICGDRYRKRRNRQRRVMAVALREETLHEQGLACVRLVNRTTTVVQVHLKLRLPDYPCADSRKRFTMHKLLTFHFVPTNTAIKHMKETQLIHVLFSLRKIQRAPPRPAAGVLVSRAYPH